MALGHMIQRSKEKMVRLSYPGGVAATPDGYTFYLEAPKTKRTDGPNFAPGRTVVWWTEIKHPKVVKRLRRECRRDRRIARALGRP